MSAIGRYEVTGEVAQGDCVIGHSFGTSLKDGGVNAALADFILANVGDRPVIADRMLADAFPNGDNDVAHVVEGEISNGVGQGVGSWGTLLEAKDFMKLNGLESALMVGQAQHIGRVAMQAKKLRISTVIPKDLPRIFEPSSDQRWTRSLGMWVPREIVGAVVLKAQKKL